MQTSARVLAAAVISVLVAAPASAQESRFSLAVKGRHGGDLARRCADGPDVCDPRRERAIGGNEG